MKHSIQTLPEELRSEYTRREAVLFQSRTRLYILVTTVIYFAVSLQYLFRKTVLLMDTFRPWELSLWAILLIGTVLALAVNRKSQTRRQAKQAVWLFTAFFLWAFSGLAVLYPETSLVFVFYYAFALLITALMIPWRLSEICWISAVYTVAFILSYDYVVFVMKYPVNVLPRYYPPVDGTIFIGISFFMSIVIRRKEIERDIHNFLLLKKVESQNSQMNSDLDLARRVHKTLVPNSVSHEKADIWVSYVPMNYVSGDYAKVRFLDANRLLVFISDVTGHGVAAALLVNRVHAEFERLLNEKLEPSALLKRLNDFISKDFEGTSMYLSAFCGLLDFDKGEFRYASYGHPSQYLFQLKRSDVRNLDSQNTLLGVTFGHEAKPSQHAVSFEPGDRLLLFTDGLIEASDPSGSAFGETRLKEFIIRHESLRDERFNERLLEELAQFRGGPFSDDIYILNIQTKALQSVESGNDVLWLKKNLKA